MSTKKRSSSVECYALEGSEPITSEYNQTEPGCLIVRDTHKELYITLTLLLNKSKFNFWEVKIMKNLLCIPFKMLPRFWFIGSSVMPFLIILLGHKYFPCQKNVSISKDFESMLFFQVLLRVNRLDLEHSPSFPSPILFSNGRTGGWEILMTLSPCLVLVLTTPSWAFRLIRHEWQWCEWTYHS